MDFMERWLHISSDHGNGSLEALILLVAIWALAFAIPSVRTRIAYELRKLKR